MAEFERVFKPDQRKTAGTERRSRRRDEDEDDPLQDQLTAPGANIDAIAGKFLRYGVMNRYFDALRIVGQSQGREAASALHQRLTGPGAAAERATRAELRAQEGLGEAQEESAATRAIRAGTRITELPLDQLLPSMRRLVELTVGDRLGKVDVRVGDVEVARSGQEARTEGELIRLAPSVDPGSEHGLRVLAHEAAHVIQQRRSPNLNPAASQADRIRRAEAEAVEVAEAALAGRRRPVQESAPAGLGFTEAVAK